MINFVGSILQSKFMPAVTPCYHVQALNADVLILHVTAARLCFFTYHGPLVAKPSYC